MHSLFKISIHQYVYIVPHVPHCKMLINSNIPSVQEANQKFFCVAVLFLAFEFLNMHYP
jgi:hypothetical protein